VASRELEDLLAAFFDRALDAEGAARLERILEADPAAADRFRQLMALEGLLAAETRNPAGWERLRERIMKSVHAPAQGSVPSVVSRVIASLPQQERKRPRIAGGRRAPSGFSPWIAVLGAAAILIGFGVLIAVGTGGDRPTVDPPELTGREVAKPRETAAEQAVREKARREADRKRLEAELARMEEARRKAEEDLKQSAEEHRRRAEEELRGIAEEYKRKSNQLVLAKEEERKAEEAVKVTSVVPEPAQKPETRASIAKVERVEGDVFVLTEGNKVRIEGVHDLMAGQGLQTAGAAGRAVLSFSDRTELQLGGDAEIPQVGNGAGKRVRVTRGTVTATVSKQPKDQPMVFSTPHGEAAVLGTTLRIVVDSDPKLGTRLEVEEGFVRLKNLAGKAVDVPSGHFAVAATGMTLVSKPLRPPNLLVDPGFEKGGRGWQPVGSIAGIAASAARVRTEGKSMELTRDAQAWRRLFQKVPAVGGATYEVSVWNWWPGVDSGGADIGWFDAAGRRVGGEIDLPKSGPKSPGWILLSSRYTAPPGAACLRFEIYVGPGSGSVYFDDAEVYRVFP